MVHFNKVFLMGNLTRDPELKYTSQGTAIAKFSIAINNTFKDAAGDLKKETEFFNIVVWGKMGETCAKYLLKGGLVHVEGRLHNRSYETTEKQKRTVTEIVAIGVQFLGSSKKADDPQSTLVKTARSESLMEPQGEEVPF